MRRRTYDFVVAGGGITGLAMARAVREHLPRASILLIEKERGLGTHASGNNSGVLHAGIYYRKDSLRAKYCHLGNRAMREFHLRHGLPLRDTGKIIAPCNPEENEQIPTLFQKAQEGHAPVEIIDAKEANRREPRLLTHPDFQYIWSPSTAVGSPKLVLPAIQKELEESGNFELQLGTGVDRIEDGLVRTQEGEQIDCGFFINAAGCYALALAKQVKPELGAQFKMVPLRGEYLISQQPIEDLGQPVIYPVPPGKKNFTLGVHTIITPDLYLKVGPSARPSWESFEGRSGFNLEEAGETLQGLLSLDWQTIKQGATHMLTSQNKTVGGKRYPTPMEAKLSGIYDATGITFGKYPAFGVRPQMVDLVNKKFHDDMVAESVGRQFHLLNVISPGWTASLPMASDLVRERVLGGSTGESGAP